MSRVLLFLLALVVVVALAPMLPSPSHPDAVALAQSVIYVNSASLEELDSLPGIGPSKAAAIIAARARRPFRRLSDLLRVPGIGRATLERLAPLLRFDFPDAGVPSPSP